MKPILVDLDYLLVISLNLLVALAPLVDKKAQYPAIRIAIISPTPARVAQNIELYGGIGGNAIPRIKMLAIPRE